MAYEFLNKYFHRGNVYIMYMQSKKPIVFLDDEHAGACHSLLEQGVPKRLLHPVNNSPKHAAAITKNSGVCCVCDDINSHLTTLKDDSHSVVWLDYTCTTIEVDVLRHALRVAPYVSVTLSLRGLNRNENEKQIRKLVNKVGSGQCYTYYKGQGAKENMFTFIVSRKNKTYEKEETYEEEETYEDKVNTFEVSDKVFVGKHTAKVVETSDTSIRVRFDNAPYGSERWFKRDRVTPNSVIHTTKVLDAMVGKMLLMPLSLWTDTKAYHNVTTVNKKLAFQVTKRYKTGKYRLCGISKHKGQLCKAENWTLSYDEALCYLQL